MSRPLSPSTPSAAEATGDGDGADVGADVELDGADTNVELDGADAAGVVVVNAGSASTLHTLLSNRTSTLGSASVPKFHLPLTNSEIGHRGILDLQS